ISLRYWYTIASQPKEYHCTWQYLRGDTWLASQTASHEQAIRNSGGYFLAHTKTVEYKRKLRILLIIVSFRCVFTVKDNVPSLDLQFKSTGKALKTLYLYNIVTIDTGFTFGKVLLL